MNRSLTVAVAAAALIASVSSGPSASADVKHRNDPRGDSTSGPAYDFVDFAVRNNARRVTATFEMATLAPSRSKIFARVDMRFGRGADLPIYTVISSRTYKGTIKTYLQKAESSSAAPSRVPCKVTATWGAIDLDFVKIRVRQSCLPDRATATFLPSTAPVADSQDPSDFLDDANGNPSALRVRRG